MKHMCRQVCIEWVEVTFSSPSMDGVCVFFWCVCVLLFLFAGVNASKVVTCVGGESNYYLLGFCLI